MRYNTVIFDLDGTVLDTSPGVLGSFKKVEQEMGLSPLPEEERNWVLGPSLHDSFTIKYGLSEEEAQEAVERYRKHYAAGGVSCCEPYSGIVQLLKDLKALGIGTRVATSKLEKFARIALESKGLLGLFDAVCAPNERDISSDKEALIRRAMDGAKGPFLMVGDRKFDIAGAQKCGIDSAYVLYGFGNEEEAKDCRPSYLVRDVQELSNLMLGRGRFFCFEGGDGSGKTTQIQRVKAYLEEKGFSVRMTREPGGTPAAEAVRDVLLDPSLTIHPITEAYLYAAARAEHVREVLRPALLRGEVVLCDRYLESSIAYQGYGRGLGEERVLAINEQAVQGFLPDRVYLFDLSDEEADRRTGKRSVRDRLELEGAQFRARVRRGYRAQAEKQPERICTILAEGSEQEVFARLKEDLDRELGIGE